MRKIILILLFTLYIPASYAVTLSGLYSVKLPIHSEVTWRRLQIMPKALQLVLMKVSGNADVNKNPVIQAALKQASGYVLQYSYVRQSSDTSNSLMLKIDFDPHAVRQLLQQAGQVVWGRNRPLSLLWLTISHGQNAQIVGSSSNSLLVNSIRNNASERGIPLLLPIMDLADMQKVTAQAVIQGQWNMIQLASQRYLPDAILLVSVNNRQPNQVTSQWSLLLQGQASQWQASGKSIDAVLDQGFNQLATILAKRYGVADSGQSQTVQLQVQGVSGVVQLAKLQRYLAELTGISHIDIATALPTKVLFSIKLNGSLNSLLEQIKLGDQLAPIYQASVPASQQQGLVYRLKQTKY